MVSLAWIGLIGSIILLALLLFVWKNYKGGKKLFSTKLYKQKLIAFATPHRLELIAVALLLITFFISDLAQNKVIDLGSDYKVIVFWNITAPALLVWEVFLILFHVILFWIFLMSLQSKATNRFYDIAVGAVALFAVGGLLAGVMVQLYHAPNVYFLGATFRPIDFYHTFVYVLGGCVAYWVMTK